MAKTFLLDRRAYLDAGGRVTFSRKDAASLLFPEGTSIPLEEAVRLGLVETAESKVDAPSGGELRHNDPAPVNRDPVVKRRGRPPKQV
jgi:hypothetical protein